MKATSLKFLGGRDYTFVQAGLTCIYKHGAKADSGYCSITFHSPRGARVHMWLEGGAVGVQVNGQWMGYVEDTTKMKSPELAPVVEAGMKAWALEVSHQNDLTAQAKIDALNSL